MTFIDEVRTRSARFRNRIDHLETEEATKTSLVLPFIAMLGYDTYDPREVVPEYTADVGIRRGEKVDYALIRDGKPSILIECKKYGSSLEFKEISQLHRYFGVTETRIGILTDGITYRFFSDLADLNVMDQEPFFEFNMLDFNESDVAELQRYTNSTFDVGDIVEAARELKYTTQIKRVLDEEFNSPSQELVSLIARRAYGRISPSIRRKFEELASSAFTQFIRERVNARIRSALEPAEDRGAQDAVVTEQEDAEAPEFTDMEQEALYVIKAILRDMVDVRRVGLRATQTYCNVLLDDNIRRRVCILRLRTSDTLRIGLLDAARQETIEQLSDLDGLYAHADSLRAAAQRLLSRGEQSGIAEDVTA